jgi:drug/metabolite transporter (DMT)-like permease
VLFAWLLLGQTPTLLQGIGGLIVLAGIALVKADERDDSAAPATEPERELLPSTP